MNVSGSSADADSNDVIEQVEAETRKGILNEDWSAALIGLVILAIAFAAAWFTIPEGLTWQTKSEDGKIVWDSSLKGTVGSLTEWASNPAYAFRKAPKEKGGEPGDWLVVPLAGTFVATLLVAFVGAMLRGENLKRFLIAFPVLFILAVLSYILAEQAVIKNYGLEYALWALLIGLIIANTVGTPAWLRPAVLGELYIKIGLVLLGADILFSRLVEKGWPGIFVSWLVTPIVLVTTYLFGQYILKIKSKTLNIVVSADMSVCGVSAAIATAAACKAKKEELSLAIGLSLFFTVIMMIAMPLIIVKSGMDPVVGGAWIGGTIDSTGAVAAAGTALGKEGLETAVTIKMIQNILIGIIAVCVAIYWTKWVEPKENDVSSGRPINIGIGEIWKRFPKFVIGFVIASLVCSYLFASGYLGELWVNSATASLAKPMRLWMFCLAFVALGLDTNIRELLPYLRSGKPVVLYVCGQAFSLILSLAMAYLMFGIIFKK